MEIKDHCLISTIGFPITVRKHLCFKPGPCLEWTNMWLSVKPPLHRAGTVAFVHVVPHLGDQISMVSCQKGPYPPCLRMADRALLAGYPRYMTSMLSGWLNAELGFCVTAPCSRYRTDSRLAPSQWETSLQSNGVSHWLGANPESAQDTSRSFKGRMMRHNRMLKQAERRQNYGHDG